MRITLVLLCLISSAWILPAQSPESPSLIAVEGFAERQLEAQRVVIRLQLSYRGEDLALLQQQMEERARVVLRELTGDPAIKKIQSLQYQIDKRIDYQTRERKEFFQIQQEIQFVLTEPTQFAALLNRLLQGEVEGYRIAALQIDNEEALSGNLYDEAYADAEAKARRLAKKAGLELGKAVEISEMGGTSHYDRANVLSLRSSAADEGPSVGPLVKTINQRLRVHFHAH